MKNIAARPACRAPWSLRFSRKSGCGSAATLPVPDHNVQPTKKHTRATETVDHVRACTIHLLQPSASHEVVAVLSGLLDAAKAGQITGLVFGASLRGQKFFCDAAGSLHKNPVSGIGMATMLVAELEHRLRREAADAVT